MVAVQIPRAPLGRVTHVPCALHNRTLPFLFALLFCSFSLSSSSSPTSTFVKTSIERSSPPSPSPLTPRCPPNTRTCQPAMTVILPAPFSPRAPSFLTSFLTEDGRAQLCVTAMRECAIVLCVCRFTETIGSGVASFPYPSECFTNGRKRIVYAETHMNKHSSRSHCLLQLRVNRVARPTPGEGGGRGEEGPGRSEHSTLVHTRRRADVDCQTTVQFRVFRAWLDRGYHHVETPRRRRSSVVVREENMSLQHYKSTVEVVVSWLVPTNG